MLLLLLASVLSAALAGNRVVAIGDLHADPEAAQTTLRIAGLMDEQGHWTGGTSVLIQTGDVTDKGPSSSGVAKLLSRLQLEAPKSGGKVIGVLGNHEMMNWTGDWRGVTPADLSEFESPAARMNDLKKDGAMGRWILGTRMVVIHDGVLYCHGGVSAEMAEMGAERLTAIKATDVNIESNLTLFGGDGPMWYRGYLLNSETEACAEATKVLSKLGVKRMVVGHTTQRDGRIRSRCGGTILGIDTGISGYAGHNFAALEIHNNDAKALYANETVDLPDPTHRHLSETP
jgi:hypothetical protein